MKKKNAFEKTQRKPKERKIVPNCYQNNEKL